MIMNERKNDIVEFFNVVEEVYEKNKIEDVTGYSLKNFVQKESPYKFPKDYIQWEDLSEVVASALLYNKITIDIDYPQKLNSLEVKNTCKSIINWFDSKCPVFVLTNDLINVLLESKTFECDDVFLNKLLSKIRIIYPNLVLLFPLNCEHLKSEEYGMIDHCFVSIENKEITLEVFNEETKEMNQLKTDKLIYWGGISDSNRPFSHFFVPSERFNSVNDSKYMRIFDGQDFNLMQLVLNALMLISSKPDLIINTDLSDIIKEFEFNKEFHSEKTKEKRIKKYLKKFIYPKVLDLNYVERTVRSDDKSGRKGRGSQSPKRPHWRLGYITENKPYGRMKGIPKEKWLRKRIEVFPYFVMGNNDYEDEE